MQLVMTKQVDLSAPYIPAGIGNQESWLRKYAGLVFLDPSIGFVFHGSVSFDGTEATIGTASTGSSTTSTHLLPISPYMDRDYRISGDRVILSSPVYADPYGVTLIRLVGTLRIFKDFDLLDTPIAPPDSSILGSAVQELTSFDDGILKSAVTTAGHVAANKERFPAGFYAVEPHLAEVLGGKRVDAASDLAVEPDLIPWPIINIESGYSNPYTGKIYPLWEVELERSTDLLLTPESRESLYEIGDDVADLSSTMTEQLEVLRNINSSIASLYPALIHKGEGVQTTMQEPAPTVMHIASEANWDVKYSLRIIKLTDEVQVRLYANNSEIPLARQVIPVAQISTNAFSIMVQTFALSGGGVQIIEGYQSDLLRYPSLIGVNQGSDSSIIANTPFKSLLTGGDAPIGIASAICPDLFIRLVSQIPEQQETVLLEFKPNVAMWPYSEDAGIYFTLYKQ